MTMRSEPIAQSLFATHTFGRDHMSPPPLPENLQPGQTMVSGQPGGDTAQLSQMYAGTAPTDLDHVVRTIGEW